MKMINRQIIIFVEHVLSCSHPAFDPTVCNVLYILISNIKRIDCWKHSSCSLNYLLSVIACTEPGTRKVSGCIIIKYNQISLEYVSSNWDACYNSIRRFQYIKYKSSYGNYYDKEISSPHSALPMTILATIRLSSKLRKTKYVA